MLQNIKSRGLLWFHLLVLTSLGLPALQDKHRGNLSVPWDGVTSQTPSPALENFKYWLAESKIYASWGCSSCMCSGMAPQTPADCCSFKAPDRQTNFCFSEKQVTDPRWGWHMSHPAFRGKTGSYAGGTTLPEISPFSTPTWFKTEQILKDNTKNDGASVDHNFLMTLFTVFIAQECQASWACQVSFS